MQKHIKMKEEQRNAIIDLLLNKSAMKQDIADYSKKVFDLFEQQVQLELDEIRKHINDKRIRLMFKSRGNNEFRVSIGSDTLVFQLHSNVFRLPDENPMWKSKYLSENGANGYFGIISIYNFLAESFEQKRYNDPGYLIGRVFMNHNEHFMVEGQGQLGFLFRDLANSKMSEDIICKIIQVAFAHALDFDLLTPPYEAVQQVSVMQIEALSSELKVATGKRLGFKFQSEQIDVVS